MYSFFSGDTVYWSHILKQTVKKPLFQKMRPILIGKNLVAYLETTGKNLVAFSETPFRMLVFLSIISIIGDEI